LPFVK